MRAFICLVAGWCLAVFPAGAISTPTGLVSRSGDLSIVLHWDRNSDSDLAGYRVYRSLSPTGPFVAQSPNPVLLPGFCDVSPSVVNGQTNYYRVTALSVGSQESPPSVTLAVVPQPFADDDAFLEYIQQVHFDYFWYLANPANGLIPDRSTTTSPCSIAAVGFGLSAIAIGIDHGWISRTAGAARVLTTLSTFLNGPQGTNVAGTIGYQGWFYHFLEMNSAVRSPSSELSSIDTALLLAGMLDVREYFDGTNSVESAIRSQVNTMVNRVNWNFMARGTDVLSMGWNPPGTFLANNWIGYNEGMLLYLLGLGAATNPLPASSWTRWTSGYTWVTNYGQAYVPFAPLFGHQYSHCWIDFRHQADSFMRSRQSSYFENSRRASVAQRSYCIANPLGRVGYSSNVWGITACDGPTGYAARGAPPALNDDGTIAPTAAGGSISFTPEYSLPTLRYFYRQFRRNIWTAFGFRDAFNLGAQWYASDELGLDQGPIVLMIENYRRQQVWRRVSQAAEIQRGLERAGFTPYPFMQLVEPNLATSSGSATFSWSWTAQPGLSYQVEYSPDLSGWFMARGGPMTAGTNKVTWTDSGPPFTEPAPSPSGSRFYRVFQLGP